MSIIIQYVVEHKGIEKLVTTDKKEADKYDKMLEVADNLAEYVQAKGFAIEAPLLEELSILLAKNKDAVAKLLRGTAAQAVLSEDQGEVVELSKRKA
jgi:dsDNA-binding SOS-regulon protein